MSVNQQTVRSPHVHFDTAGVAARDRFEFWRSWYAGAIDVPVRLDPIRRPLPDFRASADVLRVGDVAILELHCAPAIARWSRVEGAPERLHLVVTAASPGGLARLNGVETSLGRERAALLGSTNGSWQAPSGLRRIQVSLPMAAVSAPAAEVARFRTGLALDHDPVFGSLVRPLMLGMAGRLSALAGSVTDDLETMWVSLITMLVRSVSGSDLAGAELAAARRLEAERYIDAHLSDPGLDPDAVAAALRLSRRSLYGAFAAGAGVAAHIRLARLERAKAMLADPRETRSIAQIGRTVGLPDPSHFTRVFTAEFGCRPRDVRPAEPAMISRPAERANAGRAAETA